MPGEMHLNPFIIKIAARCNLNCSYCYVFNQADQRWTERPALMDEVTFDATIARIRRHCEVWGQDSAVLLFHGGEPALVGAARFEWMCRRAREALPGIEVSLSIQTNGTILDEHWIRVFREQDVQIGISLDGPKDVHDVFRVDHAGRGSHDAILENIALLRDAGLSFSILSVVQPGTNSVRVHRHFLSLGCQSIAYLLPSHTHDTVAPLRAAFGATPCADFLIPIFDEWWFHGTIDVQIREFWNIGKVIMGGQSEIDSIGNPPLSFLSIETDGAMEGLDKLRSCEDGLTRTGLSVFEADFSEMARGVGIQAQVMRGMPLPSGCVGCPEETTCAGGYLPHRYSRARGFDNPSVWCADILRLFGHLRERLGVTVEETRSRRSALGAQPARAPEPTARTPLAEGSFR